MPVLIIGWSVYDKLPEEEQKEFALVERYRTDYFYECYEYENAKGNKNYEWSDRCFNNQEELLEFFGYEMIEDLNADAVYASRVETFTDQDAKKLMKLCDAGNQIKVMGAQLLKLVFTADFFALVFKGLQISEVSRFIYEA